METHCKYYINKYNIIYIKKETHCKGRKGWRAPSGLSLTGPCPLKKLLGQVPELTSPGVGPKGRPMGAAVGRTLPFRPENEYSPNTHD